MDKNKLIDSPNRYLSFMFLRLDGKFRHLVSNEKIASKQEFENLIGSCQEKLFLRTYSLSGMKSGCDMLMWLISPEIDLIQNMWGRVAGTGIGKYLIAQKSFLGVYRLARLDFENKDLDCGDIPKNLFGKYKYMLLHPLVRSHSWHELPKAEKQKFLDERKTIISKHPKVVEHSFASYGLDDQEHIIMRESDSMEELISVCRELRKQKIKGFTVCDTPVFFCVGKDLREILDSFG